jgi:hypothetical protein
MSIQDIPLFGGVLSSVVDNVKSFIGIKDPVHALASTVCAGIRAVLDNRQANISSSTREKLEQLSATCSSFNDPNVPNAEAMTIAFLKQFVQAIGPVKVVPELTPPQKQVIQELEQAVMSALHYLRQKGAFVQMQFGGGHGSMAQQQARTRRARKTRTKTKRHHKRKATKTHKRAPAKKRRRTHH